MARLIRAEEIRRQHRTARWLLPLTALPCAALAVWTWSLGGWVSLLVALVPPAYTACRVYRSSGSSWAKGAAGERRTARILVPLVFFGAGRWAVLHDRAIPRSSANLDTMVAGPPGMVLVDSKNVLSAKSTLRVSNGQLYSGRYRMALDTVEWEASRIQQSLGTPVTAIVAVHGAAVPGGRLRIGNVIVIPASRLRSTLRRLPRQPGWNKSHVQGMAMLADARFPPKA
ncbi:nuclease-related domain-containing protein [Streptomyces erythrochromogenes]|uniref:nuclease-related domain-containing protein n=1 Tax=Streptomyces erythrochromogenes TaxID=285574 RepID=UPI0034219403